MSDWGVKPGTLYHHLKELQLLIEQDTDKHYRLNKLGKEVSDWLYQTENKVQVKSLSKMEAFTYLVQPYYNRLDTGMILPTIILLIFLSASGLASYYGILILGPIIRPAPDWQWYLILLTILSVHLVQISLMWLLASLFGSGKGNRLPFFILLGNSVSYLLVLTAAAMTFLLGMPLQISLAIWYILSIFSQLLAISVTSGALVLGYAIKPERSLIIAIASVYILTYLSFLIS